MIFLSRTPYTGWRQHTKGGVSHVSRQNLKSKIGQEALCSQKESQLSLRILKTDWRILVLIEESI